MLIDYEDDRVRVGHVVVGPIDNNVYFITCAETGESLMIDAASSASLLVEMCKRLKVTQVVETHNHWDHIGAIDEVRAAGYPVAIGKADADGVSEVDSTLVDGDVLKVGALAINAISTPGHTPGSTCFELVGHPVLFTGDTLFPGGPGATHFPGGDFPTIMRSLDMLFERFSDETIVLPGHGNATLIGAERPSLPIWKQYRP